MPEALIPPELEDIEESYWQAFLDLSSGRQAGGQIPWTAIWQYFQVEGFGDFHSFHRVIKIMDGAYMKAIERDKK